MGDFLFKKILIISLLILSGCVMIRKPDSISVNPIMLSGLIEQDDIMSSFINKIDGMFVKINWYYR